MKKNPFNLLVILIISTWTLINGEEEFLCPNSVATKGNCSSTQTCSNANLYCTLMLKSDVDTHRCCDIDTSFCTETGMASFPVRHRLTGFDWNDNLDKNIWYKKNILFRGNNHAAACPKPLSFQLYNYDKKMFVAVGFSETTQAKTCKGANDCKEDEFCGPAYNPSFCPGEAVPAKMDNKCLDKSDKGKPFSFCFKLPPADNTGKLKVRKKDGSIVGCDTNTECVTAFGDSLASCKKMPKPLKNVDKENHVHDNDWKGVCVEAPTCDVTIHKSVFGSLGVDSNNCQPSKPDSCGEANALCKTVTGLNFCCFKKPEEATPAPPPPPAAVTVATEAEVEQPAASGGGVGRTTNGPNVSVDASSGGSMWVYVGIGVGLVALLICGGAAWWCMKKKKAGSSDDGKKATSKGGKTPKAVQSESSVVVEKESVIIGLNDGGAGTPGKEESVHQRLVIP